jgi:hypothetical protein
VSAKSESSIPVPEGGDEPLFDIYRAKRHCAELEEDRDREQIITDALQDHADSHAYEVARLNHRITEIVNLIQREEHLLAF